jgi:hypothetical protein
MAQTGLVEPLLYYGNGNTDGICSSIFPLSSSLMSFSDPCDDDGGQSTCEDDCWSQSVDA